MLKVSLIGVGNWGWNHLRTWATLDDVTLQWVCDLSEERLQRAVQAFPTIQTTTDVEQALEGVDAVVIATSSSAHYRLVKKALEKGLHVFVEKPMTHSLEQAIELVALAEQKQRIFMVGHLLLYHPAIVKLKELVDRGELGDILYLYSRRLNLGRIRTDENVVLSLAPHDVSISNFLLGRKPIRVTATGWSYVTDSIEDVAFITVEYEDRRVAHFHISWLDPRKVRSLVLVGSEKMAVFDDMEPEEKLKVYDKGILRDPFQAVELPPGVIAVRYGDIFAPRVPFKEPLREEAKHFVECIQEGKRPRTDGYSGLEVMAVLEAAFQSIRQGGVPVKVPSWSVPSSTKGR